jgi:hypothetical protein
MEGGSPLPKDGKLSCCAMYAVDVDWSKGTAL